MFVGSYDEFTGFIMPRGFAEDKLDTGYLSLNNAVIRTCESALGFLSIPMYNDL